jgi:ribulose-5-phosphate 4-epimerase/fuculose-1-phosphate aldolase
VTSANALRERLCLLARSMFERGLTHGSTGNISVRCDDETFLVTPTGSSLGFLDPGRLAHLAADGTHLSGDAPTKEMPLHRAFYQFHGAHAGAVVHLHSHHAVTLSMIEGVNPDSMIPDLTPYSRMQLGTVRRVPYFTPGDPALGAALAALPSSTTAVILANHGPIVAGTDLDRAVFAIEELEASARLTLETRRHPHRLLTREQTQRLIDVFGLEHDHGPRKRF